MKNIKHVLLNDNYPVNCGSHYTMQHLKHGDNRLYYVNNKDKDYLCDKVVTYHIFPNIYPGKIKTGEGLFGCNSYFDNDDENDDSFIIFKLERNMYRWNTFIELK